MIAVIIPSKLTVQLKGAAKDIHSNTGGIYILEYNQFNGKPYWIHEKRLNAIWYDKVHGDWSIGDIKNLGSATVKMYSPDDSVFPQEATTWKYADDGEFIETTDLIILSVLGMYYLINFFK